MQGSIRKKRDKWSYRIDVGYIGGQRKQIERGGFLTKKEATVAMNEAIYKLNQTGEYIDLEKNTIKVCKQLLFQDRKWCFCPLKTVNSYRTVNITQQFANYLKSLKAQQDAERELYGDGWKRNYVTNRLKTNKETLLKIEDFVNIKQNGEMLTSNSVKFLSRVIKQDLGFQFKFHNLRHTFASVLAENGVNPKYVQKTLGHSKMEFTLKYYTHVTEKMTEKAIAAIDSSLTLAYTQKYKALRKLRKALGIIE